MSIDGMPVCSDLVEMVPSIEVHVCVCVCVCVCLLMMLFGFESYVLYCIPWLTDHSIEPRWYGCVVRTRCGRPVGRDVDDIVGDGRICGGGGIGIMYR
jgi:hypothetical protein